jgi:hypothetical protein
LIQIFDSIKSSLDERRAFSSLTVKLAIVQPRFEVNKEPESSKGAVKDREDEFAHELYASFLVWNSCVSRPGKPVEGIEHPKRSDEA